MADSTTTNLGLIKPEDGASDDTWGVKMNANMDTLDAQIAVNIGAINANTTNINTLTSTKADAARAALTASVNFDTVVTEGRYRTIDNTSTNAPLGGQYWYLDVGSIPDPLYVVQFARLLDVGPLQIFSRVKVSGVWQAWRSHAFLDSPAFTGNPTAPTQAALNNSTRLATTAYVDRTTRDKLTAGRTLYVGAVIGAPAISIASPAVVTLNAHGLSAGDPVIFNVPQNLKACTISAASPAVVTMANSFAAGQPVKFSSTGYLPTGITPGVIYYVISTGLSGASFQISTTVGGAAVNTAAITATFTNGSATITTGANHNLVNGQIVQFAGTNVVNFSNGVNYYVRSLTANTIQVSATSDGAAITAGAVTSNGTLVQNGSHFCSTAGVLPTGVTEGTIYYVIATGLTANAFQFSATVGGAAVNTSGSVTGSPVYSVLSGNDINSGLVQNKSGALLTVQAALNKVTPWDLAGFGVTIQLCATGSFAGFGQNVPFVGGTVSVVGNNTTPSNVTITSGISVNNSGVVLYMGGLKTLAPIYSTLSAILNITNPMDYGPVGASNFHLYATGFGQILGSGGTVYVSSGNGGGSASYHAIGIFQGSFQYGGYTCYMLDTPNFATSTVSANSGSLIHNEGITWIGSATSPSGRYLLQNGSGMYTGGGGAQYVPGNVAGVTGTACWQN